MRLFDLEMLVERDDGGVDPIDIVDWTQIASAAVADGVGGIFDRFVVEVRKHCHDGRRMVRATCDGRADLFAGLIVPHDQPVRVAVLLAARVVTERRAIGRDLADACIAKIPTEER